MTTTPIQKCAQSLQQKMAMTGKKITTEEAVKQCSKKFAIQSNKKD